MNHPKTTPLFASLLVGLLVGPVFAGDPPVDTSDGKTTTGGTTAQAMIEIRLVQIDAPITEMSLRGTQMQTVLTHSEREPRPPATDQPEVLVAPRRTAGRTPSRQPTVEIPVDSHTGPADLGVTVITITDDALIKLGDCVLHLAGGKFFERVGDADRPWTGSSAWKLLSAPRILANVGHEASLTVGAQVPYMVRRADGSLVVEHSEDIVEGVSVDLAVDKADEALVSFKNLNIKISTVAGRQEISGVPFDVGRPIIRSMEFSSALSLRADQMAIISLPRAAEDTPPIFVFLTARQATGL